MRGTILGAVMARARDGSPYGLTVEMTFADGQSVVLIPDEAGF